LFVDRLSAKRIVSSPCSRNKIVPQILNRKKQILPRIISAVISRQKADRTLWILPVILLYRLTAAVCIRPAENFLLRNYAPVASHHVGGPVMPIALRPGPSTDKIPVRITGQRTPHKFIGSIGIFAVAE
jgi:hypothetical protein